MASRYEGRIDHNEDSIHALFRTRYQTYYLGRVVACAAAGIALAAAGLFAPVPLWGQALLMLAGCLLFAGRELPATLRAEDAIEARGGALPTVKCTFCSGHLELAEGGLEKKLRYEKLDRLVEDKNYLYLFFGPDSVVMVARDTLGDEGVKGVMELVEKRTGKRWEAPVSLLTLNLRDLVRMWDARKAKKARAKNGAN